MTDNVLLSIGHGICKDANKESCDDEDEEDDATVMPIVGIITRLIGQKGIYSLYC
jgi:hypothetical protein